MFRKFLGCCATVAFLFCSSISFAAEKHQFMPDNDLWMEDTLFSAPAVDQAMFNKIVEAGIKVYTPYADKKNEKLVVNPLWNDSTVNANCCRGCKPNEVTVNMYGGLARRPEINPEGFAIVLCHELSHAYGGAPYIQAARQMSAEGQADYMATYECYRQVHKEIAELQVDFQASPYVEEKCADRFQDYRIPEVSPSVVSCKRGLEGGLALGTLLAGLMNENPLPRFETPDPFKTPKTMTSYPKTAQCRLDTYHNGVLQLARPACWFKN